MNYVNGNKNKLKVIKWMLIFLVFFGFIFLVIFSNFYFKNEKVTINFFDEKPENVEIKNYISSLVQNNSDTLLKFIFLNEQDITEKVHKEFQSVSAVRISKRMNLDLNIIVSKNEEFFYTCMGEDTGFLVKCMLGNTEGEFYKGIEYGDNSTSTVLQINISPKVLFDSATAKKIDEPDSLAGNRIYTKEDFKVLREILKWVQKNGFEVKKVYVDELKIVDIFTDLYKIKVSLDKGYVETVRDFEIISKTGDLQKYINEDKEKLNYIDLSYKNKVFYKLKGGNTDLTSTTSTSTMAN